MPYNPGIQDRWGENLAAGINQAGQNITGAIERHQSDAKKAKGLRSYLGELEPDTKAKFDAMGLQELEGYGQALAGKQARQAAMAQQAREAAQTEELKQRTGQMKSAAEYEAGQRAARARFMGELSGVDELTPTQYIGAAARAGLDLSGHDIPSFINSYAREKRNDQMIKGELTPTPYVSPAGNRFIQYGRQFLPDTDPALKTRPPLGAQVPLPGGQTGYFNGTTVVPLKQAPDLSVYDHDPKTGQLTRKGFNDASLAGIKGAYPGMVVTKQPGGAAAQSGGGLYDRFLQWKSGKPGATNGSAVAPILSPTAGLDDEARPEDVWERAGN
jgi:hypothetical protein